MWTGGRDGKRGVGRRSITGLWLLTNCIHMLFPFVVLPQSCSTKMTGGFIKFDKLQEEAENHHMPPCLVNIVSLPYNLPLQS